MIKVNIFILLLVGDFQLYGIDICGETVCEITNSAQTFEWKEFGLRLLISEGTLPEGIDKCTVVIKASVAGQYQFPEDTHPVSAIFILRCEPMCKFAKAVIMELEHCAKPANASKLTFVRAFCMQKSLPYVFKKIGGHFLEDDRTGTVKLNGFSILGVGQEGSSQREYGATFFHFLHQRSVINCCLKIDVVMTWNTEAHLNVSVYSGIIHGTLTTVSLCLLTIIIGREEGVQRERCSARF